MTENRSDKKHCPNCETSFDNSFKFCPNCGQANKKLSLNFKYFVSEFLSGMFNLDSKIFRTLRLLFLRPGMLTKEFIKGRRNSYIPPVRLYLIGSLIYENWAYAAPKPLEGWPGDDDFLALSVRISPTFWVGLVIALGIFAVATMNIVYYLDSVDKRPVK